MTPLYPQKLALTSLTGGGRSVRIVRSRIKATEFYGYDYQKRSTAATVTTTLTVDHNNTHYMHLVSFLKRNEHKLNLVF